MDRRQFIASSLAAGATLAGSSVLGTRAQAATNLPNILFIVVDEMRYPSVFPTGVNDVGEFLANFMPNTYKLWQNGVKFANHHTASDACSPSRGVFVTGLYSHQNWVTQTITDFPGVQITEQPVLSHAFPTYGKLLRQAGYQTPYIGKWHLSNPTPTATDPNRRDLTPYGFDYKTSPDPTGSNLQGTLGFEPDFHSDEYIANQAAAWLGSSAGGQSPWCLTVSFVNPHDKEFFPAGTEYQTFAALFPPGGAPPQQLLAWADLDLAKDIPFDQNPLRDPPSFGYPTLPPNWESAAQITANKPSTQTFARLFQQLAFGGVTDDPNQTEFTLEPYPAPPGQYGIGIGPYSYWQRGLDSYTQVMSDVDVNIGTVLDALPPAIAQNTIIVFTSDHGDFAGAHGFISGKVGTAYQEIFRVPLIVVDPTGEFGGDIDMIRNQLTSSVDITPLLVSLAYGDLSWVTGNLLGIYGRRFNMLPLLGSASAQGRPYVVFATDENVPPKYNFNNAPVHIIGLVTEEAKLGVYADWRPFQTTIERSSIQLEFYDYSTAGGLAEVDNTPGDPRAQQMLHQLLTDIIPNELQAPLPPPYRQVQQIARFKYLVYAALINFVEARDTGLRVGL